MADSSEHSLSGYTDLPIGARRERLRFADFVFTRTPAGQCSAEVSIE